MSPTASPARTPLAAPRAAERHARAEAYALLARLVLRGADPGLLAQARRTPGLREGFANAAEGDDLAADHYELFGLLAPPYAAMYLARTADAASEVIDAIRQACAAAGFTPKDSEVTPDHLGIELAFLSFAEHAIAEAEEDGLHNLSRHLERLEAEFIDLWLLSWLPVWVAAAAAHAGAWGDLAALTGALAAAHRQLLPHPVVLGSQATSAPTDNLLDDPRTDLRALGAWLANPTSAGVWLSRADITEIGRQSGVPSGFGQREQLLENLLRSSATYGELPRVARALAELSSARDDTLDSSGVAHEQLQGWHDATKRTVRALERIATAAHELAGEDLNEEALS